MPPLIEIHHLNVHFGSFHALKNLSIQVPARSIYGFLGPNGAGKSTTIRSILGLYKTKTDAIRIFGDSLARHRESVLGRIGALVESPSILENLTGLENLEITRRLRGLSSGISEQVVKTVGLSTHAQKRVKHYSTGLKQRLGIGMALLADPELLILDEPANGLDPQGQQEIRELIVELHGQGRTIFVSSHNLNEIERIITHVGIINEGEVVFQGTLADLKDINIGSVQIEMNNVQDALSRLKQRNILCQQSAPSRLNCQVNSREEIHELVRWLVEQNYRIYEVKSNQKSLEALFLSMTRKEAA